ncbi:MAG: glycosyltransferase [Crocinitomix sp.]|nr:glycosyltransferase [Crocinitomix sp.]
MSDKRLKVLFLAKWYPNKFDVLDGVFVVDHAKAAETKNDVFLLFVHSDPNLKTKREIITKTTNAYPEMTLYFKSPNTRFAAYNKFMTGILYIKNQFFGYRHIRKMWGKPDLTHIHVLLRASVLAVWLKWRRKIPFVITEHWSGYDPNVDYKISPFKKKCLAFVIKRSSALTTVSAYLQKHIKNVTDQTDFYIVSNTIDPQIFKPIEKEKHDKKRFVHVSTLDNYPKNFGRILEVIGRLTETRTDFELQVIGKGVEMETQKALAKSLGVLDKTVFFRGFLPKEQVAIEIAKSDLMLLFSHYETQSCVLLESFLCGVPAIAPEVGGVVEIVNANNGVLVPHDDADAFYDALQAFLDGKLEFDPGKIRDEAMRFAYADIGEQFDEIYRATIKFSPK